MMPPTTKISHTTHMLLKGLLENKLIVPKAEESEVRREIKEPSSTNSKSARISMNGDEEAPLFFKKARGGQSRVGSALPEIL